LLCVLSPRTANFFLPLPLFEQIKYHYLLMLCRVRWKNTRQTRPLSCVFVTTHGKLFLPPPSTLRTNQISLFFNTLPCVFLHRARQSIFPPFSLRINQISLFFKIPCSALFFNARQTYMFVVRFLLCAR
jgi:hypothetical protein